MFFDPNDVLYYKDCDVYTKHGLQAKILESVGTKGLMKLHFNGFVKPNDVVCINVFKRQYPKINF